MTKLRAFLLATVAAFTALAVFSGAASAAPCNLPPASGANLTDAPQLAQGVFTEADKGKFVQIPFTVPEGTTGLRIRYCYDNTTVSATTIDMGVYEPLAGGDTQYGTSESRGWSGSAVKVIGLGVNGFTDPATYESSRKAYVPGKTTRAYKPGAIPAGTWVTELGLGWLPKTSEDPDGVDWKVEVTTSSDAAWSNAPYVPDNYAPYVANPAAGWYEGDLHVHGEEEPGNALMTQTFGRGFGALPAGNGLDFMTLVDHNNIVARGEIGRYDQDYPGKLIIPGTEETTYNGHFNSQNSDKFTDFRLGPIYKFTDANSNSVLDSGELALVRGVEDPSSRFAEIDANGGWAQINHPTIFQTAPSYCRGCYWAYTDEQTDFSKVDAIEVSTGPSLFPSNRVPPSTTANPFLAGAITFYERALATGAHVAAVASSDDHSGGAKDTPNDPTDSQVGRGSTVVYANELSQAGITAAIKADHTYAKPFGADAPDVSMTASTGGKEFAIPGDTVTAPSTTININVKQGGPGATRPGEYLLEILQDGLKVDSIVVTSDDFNHSYTATKSGRYSFELSRTPVDDKLIEAYSSPIWFTQKDAPSSAFKVTKTIYNKKKGTADLKLKVTSPGSIGLAGKGAAKSSAKVKKVNSTVTLKVKATGKTKKTLKKKSKAKVKVTITNSPTGGSPRKMNKSITLKLKKSKKK